jgi:hypothetical protein
MYDYARQGSAAGSPATEDIEITPEMTRAGLREFYRYDPDWGAMGADAVVREIYTAMVRAGLERACI